MAEKKYPELAHLTPAKTDAVHYPGDDRTGFFNSMDVIKISSEIKMDALQEWFRRGLVRPTRVTEGPTGWVKWFHRSGLLCLFVFKRLVDFGCRRKDAERMVKIFHSQRIKFLEEKGTEPDFVFFKKKPGQAIGPGAIEFISGNFPLSQDMDDALILNIHKILAKIDAYSRG